MGKYEIIQLGHTHTRWRIVNEDTSSVDYTN